MRYFIDTEFLEDGRTIELISVGVIAEDGREYYAEAHLLPDLWKRIQAHEWLMANVVPYLGGNTKPLWQIAVELQQFTYVGGEPEFWGYCSAYDWVVLNQLFGSMVDHPSAWPFYCNDIAQYALQIGINRRHIPTQEHFFGVSQEHNALADARWTQHAFWWLQKKQAEG